MANIKSAQKRISTIDRRNSENRYVRAKLSTMVKKFRKMLAEGKVEDAEKYSREVYSYIDSACSKGVIHKNTASRKVGRLASALYKAKNVTPAPEKKEEVKAEEKVEAPKVEETKEEVKAEKKPAKATKAKAEPKTAKAETKTAKATTEKKATAKTATTKKEATTEKKTTAKKETTKATATKKTTK